MKIIIVYWRCLMVILLFFIIMNFYNKNKNSDITIRQRHDFYENIYLDHFNDIKWIIKQTNFIICLFFIEF